MGEISRSLSFLCLSVCAVMFGVGLLQGKDMLGMFLTAVSLAVAAIPEGLPAIVTIVLMLAVAWLLVKKIVRHPLGVTAGVLILGGGIGNVIDRVCRGYVVDMFDLQFISYPIFNLADCFVVVGVILGAVYYLWFYDKYDKKEPKDDAASES